MSDIGLTWDSNSGGADFAVTANDLALDDGLETAVYLSLFTDRQALDGDVLPEGMTDRRGWWGDEFPLVAGDKIGSRLWLLAREKSTPAVVSRAQEYAREALQWLVDDHVAASVDVTTTLVSTGVLGLSIAIVRPTGDRARYQYQYTWAAQAAKRAA